MSSTPPASTANVEMSGAAKPVRGWLAVPTFALLASLAAKDAGYLASAWTWTTLVLLWLLVLILAFRRCMRVSALEVVLLSSLGLFVGWVFLSAAWSSSLTRTVLEGQRGLLYATAAVTLVFAMGRQTVRPLAVGVWAAIAVVSIYSLLTRLVPERLGAFDPIAGYRLSEPVGYWNALGIFAAVGAILGFGLAVRDPRRAVRGAAGASSIPLLLTLYFTFSRGAWVALGVGVLTLLVLEKDRLQTISALPVFAGPAALGIWAATRLEALTRPASPLVEISREGHRLLLLLAALVVLSTVAAVGFPSVAARLRPSAKVRVGFAGALALAAAAGLAAVFVHFGSPATLARRAYDAFDAPPPRVAGDLNARLFSLSGSWRARLWREALDDYGEHRWLGSGAGTYELYWLEHRSFPLKVIDAHSLYVETLAELGPLGLALLVVGLATPFAAARRARRHALAAPALGAYSAYLVHAGVDWDWEMPAVTLSALACAVTVLALGRRDASSWVVGRRGRTLLALFVALAIPFTILGVVSTTALASADGAARDGDWTTAAAEARKARRWAPWSAQPWQQLGEAQLARGERSSARVSFRRAIEREPADWRLWFDLALASDGHEQAQAVREAARLNPLSPELESSGLSPGTG